MLFQAKKADTADYYDLGYISVREFRKYKRQSEEKPVIRGYVDLNDKNRSNGSGKSKRSKYAQFSRKKPFCHVVIDRQLPERQVLGYIRIAENGFIQLKKRTYPHMLVFFAVWTFLLFGFSFYNLAMPNQFIFRWPFAQETDKEPLTLANVIPWNGFLPRNGENTVGKTSEIEIPGYYNIVIYKSEPFLDLINPTGNEVYFVYDLIENGVPFYTSDAISPGTMLPVPLGDMLETGEHSVQFSISCFDVETQAPCNGATQAATVTIKE